MHIDLHIKFNIRVVLVYQYTCVHITILSCVVCSCIFTACNDWDLRLVDGFTQVNDPQPQEGRVEVCFNNTYGSICHNQWNDNDAEVVCRQLGYSIENTSAQINAFYNSSFGPIYLNNVQCTGAEGSLQDCDLNTDVEGCTEADDAGVSCRGIYIQRTLQTMSMYLYAST